MITNLAPWINILFLTICLAIIILFYYSNNKPKKITLLIIVWGIMNSYLAYNGFYLNAEEIPPRFSYLFFPLLITILYSLNKYTPWIIKNRNLKISTILHVVRLPVELILFQLFLAEMIPELMTFEGRNYDIIMGISAPFVALFFVKNKINNKVLFAWNVIGLILILSILVNAILSAELPIQQFAFDQPNKAITFFPFILLPALIVPIVIWTHISDLILLLKKIKSQ